MTPSQQKAFDFISLQTGSQLLCFVTCPGGCGKYLLLHTLVLHYELSGLLIEVLATSRNAALLINGRTIHSFFKLNPELSTSIQRFCLGSSIMH